MRKIVAVVTALALAVLLAVSGVAVCLAPPVTQGLSSMFARDDLSPLDRNELVKVAMATRDYSFGPHDELALYQVIYDVDTDYLNRMEHTSGMPLGFPQLHRVSDRASLPQLKSAFAGASELYCFSPETVSHLDDCHAIMAQAVPWVIACAIIAVAGLAFTGATGGARRMRVVLVAAGTVVLVAFAGLGIWAAVNFAGFFAAFHGLFFSQGNWTFPYDSLLICSLPTEFWMGMGAIWLLVSVLASVLSIVVGLKVGKRAPGKRAR